MAHQYSVMLNNAFPLGFLSEGPTVMQISFLGLMYLLIWTKILGEGSFKALPPPGESQVILNSVVFTAENFYSRQSDKKQMPVPSR